MRAAPSSRLQHAPMPAAMRALPHSGQVWARHAQLPGAAGAACGAAPPHARAGCRRGRQGGRPAAHCRRTTACRPSQPLWHGTGSRTRRQAPTLCAVRCPGGSLSWRACLPRPQPWVPGGASTASVRPQWQQHQCAQHPCHPRRRQGAGSDAQPSRAQPLLQLLWHGCTAGSSSRGGGG